VALDQSALLEVLDALQAAEVDDRIRQAAQTIHQALIEAELTAVIGAASHERSPGGLQSRFSAVRPLAGLDRPSQHVDALAQHRQLHRLPRSARAPLRRSAISGCYAEYGTQL
jgi:hypothetical protein